MARKKPAPRARTTRSIRKGSRTITNVSAVRTEATKKEINYTIYYNARDAESCVHHDVCKNTNTRVRST